MKVAYLVKLEVPIRADLDKIRSILNYEAGKMGQSVEVKLQCILPSQEETAEMQKLLIEDS
jgi:hypothetical protein